jgi:hypothetical protein
MPRPKKLRATRRFSFAHDTGGLLPRTGAATALFLGIFFIATLASATVIPVGPARTYTTPSQAAAVSADGDIIEIDAGIYLNDATVWRRNNLTLRGVGGRAHLKMTQQIDYIPSNDQANGKGIWVTQGSNMTIENIEFSGASVADQNGAGIRHEGNNLTIRNCYFHNNENGFLGEGGALVIEKSEFAYNGFGDGYTHNLYVGNTASLTFRGNYSHHAIIGHTLKSRALENYILYNRITDETGTASYEIDLPNGGRSVIMGNLIQQSATTDNSAIISYGAEGLSNTLKDLYVVNNTVVNNRSAGGIFVSTATGTTASIQNNLFAGSGTQLSGPGTLTSNLASANPGLVNPAAYDYRLLSASPARDAGTNAGVTSFGFALTPSLQYLHPMNSETRPQSGALDIGAYEYAAPIAVTLSASPATVNSGSGAMLVWNSTGSSCAANGAWSGAKASSGSQVLTNLIATGVYTLTCNDAGGSASQSATITVTQ